MSWPDGSDDVVTSIRCDSRRCSARWRGWGTGNRGRYRTRRQPDRTTHLIIETVTGPVRLTDVRSALAHEHMFVDFHRPEEPEYLDIDWHEVLGVCAESVVVLRRLGVDLIVDYTSIGVGRNVTLLRGFPRGPASASSARRGSTWIGCRPI